MGVHRVLQVGDSGKKERKEKRGESSIHSDDNSTSTQMDTFSIAGLIASSFLYEGRRVCKPYWLSMNVIAFLAVKDFNSRSGDVVKNLPHVISNQCPNLQLKLNLHNPEFNPLLAAQNLCQGMQGNNDSDQYHAVLGGVRSTVSKTLAVLSGTAGITQMSPFSRSPLLSNRGNYPYFARTITKYSGKPLILYLKHLGITHFGVVYANECDGIDYQSSILSAAQKASIQVTSTSYDIGMTSTDSIRKAVNLLKQSQLKYFFAILDPMHGIDFLTEAFNQHIIGSSEFVWLFSETAMEWISAKNAAMSPVAPVFNGVGIIQSNVPVAPSISLSQKFQDFLNSESLQKDFFAINRDDNDLSNCLNRIQPKLQAQHALVYDAVISLGMAACSGASSTSSTFDRLLSTNFYGASGRVSFDRQNGDRENGNHVVLNVILESSDDFSEVWFNVKQTAVMDSMSDDLRIVGPFYFSDGSIEQPQALPPVDEHLNLITPAIVWTGLGLSVLVMAMSLFWIGFTFRYSNVPKVRRSQPPFLHMTAIGTFIMASSIIPSSFQEPISQHILDKSCMAGLWLLSFGFVTSFSAVFCKMWRLNKVVQKAQKFRKVKVLPEDVIYPFLILLGFNVVVLSIWSNVDPLIYVRKYAESVDEFGRFSESTATCESSEPDNQFIFYFFYFAVNIAAVVFANYQSFLARNHPYKLNETYFVVISMASILESALLGLPVLFLVSTQNPSAAFLTRAILITIVCLAILLPLFVPKFLSRNPNKKEMKRVVSLSSRRLSWFMGRNSIRSSVFSNLPRVQSSHNSFVTSKVWEELQGLDNRAEPVHDTILRESILKSLQEIDDKMSSDGAVSVVLSAAEKKSESDNDVSFQPTSAGQVDPLRNSTNDTESLNRHKSVSLQDGVLRLSRSEHTHLVSGNVEYSDEFPQSQSIATAETSGEYRMELLNHDDTTIRRHIKDDDLF